MSNQETLEHLMARRQAKMPAQEAKNRLLERYTQSGSAVQLQGGRRMELVLVIDTTGSMQPFLDLLKRKFGELLHHLCAEEALKGLRFSIVFYKDHDNIARDYDVKEYVSTRRKDGDEHFADRSEIAEVLQFMHSYGYCSEGGYAEALGAALHRIAQFTWSTSQRIVINLGDKPTHGYDSFGGHDSLDLCPYRMEHQQIIRIYKRKSIKIFSVCCGDCAPAKRQYKDLAHSTGGASIEFDKLDSLEDILVFLELVIKASVTLVSPEQFLEDRRRKHLIGSRTQQALLTAFTETTGIRRKE